MLKQGDFGDLETGWDSYMKTTYFSYVFNCESLR